MVRVFRMMCVLLLAAILTSCTLGQKPLATSDITGTWVTIGPQGQRGTIVFDSDGSFAGTNLPDRVFYTSFDPKFGGPADWSNTDKISGTWSVQKNESSNQYYVVMDIVDRFGGAKFDTHGSSANVTIEYPIGIEDDGNYLKFNRSPK